MSIQVFKPIFDVEACLSQIRECLERGWTGMGFKTVEKADNLLYFGLENKRIIYLCLLSFLF